MSTTSAHANGSTHAAPPPVVFVHGLWLHAESWDPWVGRFRERGYDARAASWPGDGESTESTRRNPAAVAGVGVREIADHVAKQLPKGGRKPVVIGHSFGGLLAQVLLDRGVASAAVAIDPAPVKGVPELPFSALRASFPVLGNPLNFNRAVSLSEAQFRYAFTNALPEREAKELYARYAMPAPARPLFQAATASINPDAATRVNLRNPTRGPLLLIAGGADHTVPPVMVRSALRAYGRSRAVTELQEFADRGHSLTIDSGWSQVADACLEWMKGKGM